MSARPVVQVRNLKGESTSSLPLPAVFTAPIRGDVVSAIHKSLNKNKRQAYSVNVKAGHQTSAESWGTGRAVARIPRVGGGGTHRSGQAAFGNMCRGGRMFAPTKVWRKWHVKVSVGQRRYARISAIAATSVVPLVQARGHAVSGIAEIPLVVSDELESVKKTKEAVAALQALQAHADVVKVINSKKVRAGSGKARNRKFRQRKGPLVIYNNDAGIVKAFNNIPGVETSNVNALNLLQLAPGGHLGRFVIWTESAFAQLDPLFADKIAFNKVSNADITRIINSDEIQAVASEAGSAISKRPFSQKKNPLKNKAVLYRLNPYAKAKTQDAKLPKDEKLTVAGEKFLSTLFSA